MWHPLKFQSGKTEREREREKETKFVSISFNSSSAPPPLLVASCHLPVYVVPFFFGKRTFFPASLAALVVFVPGKLNNIDVASLYCAVQGKRELGLASRY